MANIIERLLVKTPTEAGKEAGWNLLWGIGTLVVASAGISGYHELFTGDHHFNFNSFERDMLNDWWWKPTLPSLVLALAAGGVAKAGVTKGLMSGGGGGGGGKH